MTPGGGRRDITTQEVRQCILKSFGRGPNIDWSQFM